MPKPYLFPLSKYASLQEDVNFPHQPSPHFSVWVSFQLMLSMFPLHFISTLFCILLMFTKPPPGTHHLCIYTAELRTQSATTGQKRSWAPKVFQAANTLVCVLWKPFGTDQSLSVQVSSLAFSLHVLPFSSCRPPDTCPLSRWHQAHKKLQLLLHELPQKNPHWITRNSSLPKKSATITISITINISSQLPNT